MVRSSRDSSGWLWGVGSDKILVRFESTIILVPHLRLHSKYIFCVVFLLILFPNPEAKSWVKTFFSRIFGLNFRISILVCVWGRGGRERGDGGGGINTNRYFKLIGREISLILFQSFGLGDGGQSVLKFDWTRDLIYFIYFNQNKFSELSYTFFILGAVNVRSCETTPGEV